MWPCTLSDVRPPFVRDATWYGRGYRQPVLGASVRQNDGFCSLCRLCRLASALSKTGEVKIAASVRLDRWLTKP